MVIIDSDSMVYASCFAVKKQMDGDEPPTNPKAEVRYQLEKTINKILSANHTHTEYIMILTGGFNFRHQIFPEYKANRDKLERPPFYEYARACLMKHHDAWVCPYGEADDWCRILYKEGDVLVHIDKDLDQIAGHHYNYNRREHYEVTELQGLHNLYTQALTGDIGDNIPGFKKLTGKNASAKRKKGLLECTTEKECWEYVCDQYMDTIPDDEYTFEAWDDLKTKLKVSMQCLYLMKTENDIWSEPGKLAKP